MNRCVLSGLMVALALTGPAFAAENTVKVRTTDQSITLEGELLSYDDEVLILRTQLGNISVSRDQVQCEGAACPGSLLNADITLAGSSALGRNLLPALIENYAGSQNARIVDRLDLGDDTIAMDVRGQDGQGETLFTVSIQSRDSAAGLEGMLASANDVAMSTRPAKTAEITSLKDQQRGDLQAVDQDHIVAFDSVAIVVSPQNPVQELTEDQVTSIFSGSIWNWRQVGGPNKPITVYTQRKRTGTYAVFNAAISAAQASGSSNAVAVVSSQDMATRVAADTGGIGYVSFGAIGAAKPLDLITSCGIRMTPTPFAAKSEEYILQRRLRLFVDNAPKANHLSGLLDFAVSPDADKVVRQAGFVDLGIEEDRTDAGAERLFAAANAATEVPALRTLRQMLLDLHGATRLSTTFRFERGSLDLDTKSKRDLGRIAEYMSRPENQGRDVLLIGFTDSDGDFRTNVSLSKQRAEAVLGLLRAELGDASGAPSRLRATGYGELSPVGCNEFADGRRRNRRVEVWIR